MRMQWMDWIKSLIPHRRTPKVKPVGTGREPSYFKLVRSPDWASIDDTVLAMTKSEARAVFKNRLGIKGRHFKLVVQKVT